jgi:hypothetical protein
VKRAISLLILSGVLFSVSGAPTGGSAMTALSATPTQAAPRYHHHVDRNGTGQRINLSRECARYASQGIDGQECVRQATIALDATAKYRDFKAALADGFLPISECEQTAAGAMGQHWARLDRMAIDGVDPRTPELLLYLPSGLGFELVGVEYEESARVGGLPYYGSSPPDQSKVSPTPVMFGGRTFDGPMQGHVAIQPWHYDLHLWLWQPNPSGLFAQYNPDLSC